MGKYLNVGNAGFASIRKSNYVDKTGMISFVNGTLGTSDKLTCVSRPRRFGKSFAAKMLCVYYEYTMTQPEPLEEFVGFTQQEVQELCTGSRIAFDEIRKWYDGYRMGKAKNTPAK